MLSYSESTALGYEPESRKWGANRTLVEHGQRAEGVDKRPKFVVDDEFR